MMSSRARRTTRQALGFTLVEVIVVLAVVLLLTGIAVPMISGYMEDGRRAKAEAEIKMLSAAITAFYRDTGVYPARSNAGVNNGRYVVLSGPSTPAANPWSAGHAFWTWGSNPTQGDLLDNHLRLNTPGGSAGGAYPVTGSARWRGPYLAGTSPLDPWGRPYIVNVIAGFWPTAPNYRRLFVLSAGPNGRIDTAAAATATTDIGGDDIGVILGQQR